MKAISLSGFRPAREVRDRIVLGLAAKIDVLDPQLRREALNERAVLAGNQGEFDAEASRARHSHDVEKVKALYLLAAGAPIDGSVGKGAVRHRARSREWLWFGWSL